MVVLVVVLVLLVVLPLQWLVMMLLQGLVHRPECYCLLRYVLAVPSFSMRGIMMVFNDMFSSMNRRLSIKRSDL